MIIQQTYGTQRRLLENKKEDKRRTMQEHDTTVCAGSGQQSSALPQKEGSKRSHKSVQFLEDSIQPQHGSSDRKKKNFKQIKSEWKLTFHVKQHLSLDLGLYFGVRLCPDNSTNLLYDCYMQI